METLALARKSLEVFGLYLKDSNNKNYGRFTNCTVVVLLTGFLMITIEFILSHSDDTADALYAIMQFVTFSTVWTCYICFANQKHLTFEFLRNLQEIVDDYRKCCILVVENQLQSIFSGKTEKKHGQRGLYDEAEKKSHLLAKWTTIWYFAASYGVSGFTVIDIIISYLMPGELQPGEWYTCYKMT